MTAPDSFAGKRAKCKCGAVLVVPESTLADTDVKIMDDPPRPAAKAAGKPRPHAPKIKAPEGAHERPGRRVKGTPKSKDLPLAYIIMGVIAVVVVVGLIFAVSANRRKHQQAADAIAAAAAAKDAATRADAQAPATVVAVDPMSVVPADVKGVGFVNLKQLAASGLLASLANSLDLKALDLDPQRDLNTAALVFDGPADNAVNAIVISGKFRTNSIYRVAKGKGNSMVETSYKEMRVLTGKDDKSLAVIDGRLLVAGSQAGVNKIIDVYKGEAKAMAKDAPLMARAKNMAGSTFWFVADIDLPAPPDGQAGPDFSKVKSATVSGTASDKSFVLNGSLGCVDDKGATALADGLNAQVQGLAAVAGFLIGADEKAMATITELTKSIKINSKAAATTIDVSLAPDMIEKLKALKITPPPKPEKPATAVPDVQPDLKKWPKDGFDPLE